MSVLDTIKEYSGGLVDIAKDASSIRDSWGRPSAAANNQSTASPKKQAQAQANLGQAQGQATGRVPVVAQWDTAKISQMLGGGTGLVIGIALVLVVVLVALRRG